MFLKLVKCLVAGMVNYQNETLSIKNIEREMKRFAKRHRQNHCHRSTGYRDDHSSYQEYRHRSGSCSTGSDHRQNCMKYHLFHHPSNTLRVEFYLTS